jgi:hypothetical protein
MVLTVIKATGLHDTDDPKTWDMEPQNRILSKANSNILLQLADLGASSDFYRQFFKTQIDYILGDSGRSYVVGFGNNPPTHARHRSRYVSW